jgi:hypothetical protein
MKLSAFVAHLELILKSQGDLDLVLLDRSRTLNGIAGVVGIRAATFPEIVQSIVQRGDPVTAENGTDARFVELADAKLSPERRGTLSAAGAVLLMEPRGRQRR